MVVNLNLLLLLVFASSTQVYSTGDQRFDQVYKDGLKAYVDERWSEAEDLIRQAVYQYNATRDELYSCVRQCRQSKMSVDPEKGGSDELAKLQLQLVHVSQCVKKCRKASWQGVASDVVHTFDTRLPLDFLQYSLYKNGKSEEACRWFVTFHYFNPEAERTEENLHYYKSLGLSKNSFVPLETLPYKDLYIDGMSFYDQQKWSEAVDKFELSLRDFYIKLDECYITCEAVSSTDEMVETEYYSLLTELLMSSLKCRTKCVDKLDSFRLNTDENILSSYFQYLQYSYFKIGRLPEALSAFAALKKISPNSSIVTEGDAFYKKQAPESSWTIRESDAHVIQQIMDDQALLKLFYDVSGKDEHGGDKEEDDATLLQQDFLNHPVGEVDIEPTVTQTDDELLGPNRVVFDNVLTPHQCQLLIDLAALGTEGDGYNRKSPHTSHERFQGLSAMAAAEAVSADKSVLHSAELYLNSSEISRAMVEKHFKLDSLYFSYTHLVCRTAIEDGQQEFRDDLSHPAHSDNCILDASTGECNKIAPAYTWRDYSAILYLNDEFDGGKFFFSHGTKDLSPQTYVSPKCGRLVGFSAGKENIHGVTAVTSGRRCAVALWFTLDQNYKELQYDEAVKMLLDMKT